MDFFYVPVVVVRGFEDERLILQGGVQGDALHRLHADLSRTELFVAILVRAAGVFAVVVMHRVQAVKPDDPVESGQDAVEIVYKVVSRVPDMAGVEAYAELAAEFHAIDDGVQLLKSSRTVVCISGNITSFSASAISSIPLSVP